MIAADARTQDERRRRQLERARAAAAAARARASADRLRRVQTARLYPGCRCDLTPRRSACGDAVNAAVAEWIGRRLVAASERIARG